MIRSKPTAEEDLALAAMFSLDALATAYAGSATPTGKKLLEWAKHSDLDSKRRYF